MELTFRSYGVKELEGVKTFVRTMKSFYQEPGVKELEGVKKCVCFMSLTRFISVNTVLTSSLLLHPLPALWRGLSFVLTP